jgi:hypothetical protein
MGLWIGHPNLEASDEATFFGMGMKLKAVE